MIDRNNSPVSSEAQTSFDVNQWRESFIITILRVSCLLGIVLIGVSFPTSTTNDKFLFIGLYLALLAITLLKIPYTVRASAIVVMLLAVGFNSILAWGPWIDGSIFLFTGVVLSSLLFDRRVDLYVLATSILIFIVIAILQSTGSYELSATIAPSTNPIDWAGYIFDYTFASAVLVIAAGQFKNAFLRIIKETQIALKTVDLERSQLEAKVLERTEDLESRMTQLRTSTLTARSIAEIQNVSELLENTTKLIAENFGYYHTGLFIIDTQKKIAYLQASSSATGKLLIGQGFRVEPDRKNPLANVFEQNRALISSDIDQKNFVADDNFPLTRSRMILPLAVQGSVIGLLDLHSDQPRAFSLEDAEVLQTLADLTAITFDNARLIAETKNLVAQLEANTALQTQRTWRKLTSRQSRSYQYTPAGVRPVFFRDNKNEGDGLQIPLTLHSKNIGSIKLKRKNNLSDWSEREKDLVEKIADQVSLALENSRLVEEAQKSAVRDQMIANISTRIRESLDFDSVARTAAEELRRIFDLKEAEILISAPQETSSKRETNSLY